MSTKISLVILSLTPLPLSWDANILRIQLALEIAKFYNQLYFHPKYQLLGTAAKTLHGTNIKA